jgi:hypothetical protein
MIPTIALGAILAAPSSHGTLVIPIETTEGIVMCADRREYNRQRGASDNQDKIFKLSRTSAFSISGNRGILRPGDLHVFYDVPEVVTLYVNQHADKTIDNNWEGLKHELAASYVRYLTNGGPVWNAEPTFDNWLYILTFIYLDAGQKIQLRRAGAQLGRSSISVSDVSAPIGEIFGQTEVASELKDGHDPRFDDVRRQPIVRAFYGGQKTAATTSVSEALSFSKILIQTTSQRYLTIKPSGTPLVSENYDCGILRRTGFAWLKQDAR